MPLGDGSDESSFLFFWRFFFLLRFFLFDFLELLSFDKSDFFDEFDNDGSGSGSPGKSFVSAGDVGFGDFVPSGTESLGYVVTLVVFVSRGIESHCGRLMRSFWRSKY